MSVSALIAPELPLLRRYARALCGSQASGDAHVVAMLESLLVSTDGFDRQLDPRVATYRLFTSIWNANPINALRDTDGWASPPERRIERISPLPRQAFLLSAVEGFSPANAASILGIDAAGFDACLTEAARQIGEQMAARVLIIEDEPLIAMDLEALVEDLGHSVVGNARTRSEAIAMARAERPDLILADVRLADGSSGIDAVNDILDDFDVPAIFITAFPQSLLTGERREPTFLIAKPFREDTVRAIISQALFFRPEPDARWLAASATAN